VVSKYRSQRKLRGRYKRKKQDKNKKSQDSHGEYGVV
jgi:hypothetical protein